jgi:hypothetical protein
LHMTVYTISILKAATDCPVGDESHYLRKVMSN